MSVLCSQFIKEFEKYAPIQYAEKWDNVGLLVGDSDSLIETIIICLDVTDKIIDEAIEKKAQLILSHHPIIFKDLKDITSNTALGKKLIKCIKNNIGVYVAHTNLDMAINGTNDALFDKLELTNKQFLCDEVSLGYALGRVGLLKKPYTLSELALFVKGKLDLETIKYVGDGEKIINKVSLCTGSCSSNYYFDQSIKNNCDVYITSDIKHHEALDALEKGLMLIDATHYATEVIVSKNISNFLNSWAKENKVNILESHKQKKVFNYI